ncbi:translation elongation factor-like protein [Candidatus Woesearchaeota archaeon]|nr:translation elongation factor-like protein [Candidatus Woesearchaeota archaeon]
MAKEVGKVFAYYSNIGVAAIKLSGALKVGDTIAIKGHTTDITQRVESIQIEHEKVKEAKKGDEIGIKVSDRVRLNDVVYKD